MQQSVHGRQNAKAVAEMQLLDLAVTVLDLDGAVYEHAPAVELLAVIQNDHSGSLDHRENHHGTKRPPHRQSHIRKGLQLLREFQ